MELLKNVSCPHCWGQFPPETVYWISEHQDLLGDPRLGPEHQQRFLPSRFTIEGEALDPRGFPCRHLACPKCHLILPRTFLEYPPLFLSIAGAPTSGKSYFLAAMTSQLRKVLPLTFGVDFADADTVLNSALHACEESLFAHRDEETPVPLGALIRKTEEQGDLYDTVAYGNQVVTYPRPFVFTLQPSSGELPPQSRSERSRSVCLYDNAGESFQAGKDSAANPVTRHMAHSGALMYVFDPTQDTEFRKRCDSRMGSSTESKLWRQGPILQETIARIRSLTKLKQSEKHPRPLIVILTKCDAWLHLLGQEPGPEPWRRVTTVLPGQAPPKSAIQAFDLPAVETRSGLVEDLLLKYSPEIVTLARGFASRVYFVPISAIGWKSVPETGGRLLIRPVDVEPYWVTVPFLLSLALTTPGLIPTLRRKGG